MVPIVLFLCIPDSNKPIGGVKQIYKHAESICSFGRQAFVVTEKPGFKPSWFSSAAKTISFEEIFAHESINFSTTILVLPETYVTHDLSNYRGHDLSGYSYVIFNQNVYFTFQGLNTNSALSVIHNFYRSANMLQVLTVSSDNLLFIANILGVDEGRISRIIHGIGAGFESSNSKENIITWMPRKNRVEAAKVLTSIDCGRSHCFEKWHILALDNISHDEVALHLNKSKIFLSFGHPEGFGLPIAEAMASGCWVIGYSGIGGDELFEFGASTKVNYGDWSNFVSGVNSVIEKLTIPSREFDDLLAHQSREVKSIYSVENEAMSIKTAWERILAKFNSSND
tara:strand:+ start:190 stop:1209 length:1020 start_codon:yes stop_codon:yes gene_type:complete